jgi:hypothetical protein
MNEVASKLNIDKQALNSFSKNVLRVLLYFDIFKHPLKAEEIFKCCSEPSFTLNMAESELKFLLSQSLVTQKGDYFLPGMNHDFVRRRVNGETKASATWKTAYRFSKLISMFPYVRGICVSGSLSKGYMDHETDIDYFIITKAGRLWLSRSLLVLFKKIFLLNSRKYFCVNYFIDENNLRIPDKNFFTATELAFVVPTYNYDLYRQLMERNSWIKNYYPYFPIRTDENVLPVQPFFFKRILEKVFKEKLGEKLDNFFFRLTINHWKKKFVHFDERTFDLRLRSRKNVSKHHPKGFQEKILSAWEEKIDLFEMQHGVEIR